MKLNVMINGRRDREWHVPSDPHLTSVVPPRHRSIILGFTRGLERPRSLFVQKDRLAQQIKRQPSITYHSTMLEVSNGTQQVKVDGPHMRAYTLMTDQKVSL